MLLDRRDVLTGISGALLASAMSRAERQGAHILDESHVFELRQYTLRGGQRDTLIKLFEDHFIEPQEALGAQVVGMFRDADDPDRFVWIRGFRDMAVRQASLTSFYGGPVWKAHRTQANATMIDSDNVLLLRQPTEQSRNFVGAPAQRRKGAIYGARIFTLGEVEAEAFAAIFFTTIIPQIQRLGVLPIATFISETASNNFPALPVRGDRAFVWIARWPSIAAEQQFDDQWHSLSGLRDAVPENILPALMRKPEHLRLLPTIRSALQ
jgi:hypothetical protein